MNQPLIQNESPTNVAPPINGEKSGAPPAKSTSDVQRERFENLTKTVPLYKDSDLPEKATEETETISSSEEDIFSIADNVAKGKDNEWAWSEKLKGEGERPDWMKKEFKSVEAQAKAYNDLIKKFGSFHGAPETYDFSEVENSKFHVHSEAENSKKFSKIGKDLNLSQEGFNTILKFFNETVAPTFKNTQGAPVDSRAEIAKLGENGHEMVKTLDVWLKNNFTSDYQVLRGMMKTAESIKAFNKIRGSMLGNLTQPSINFENNQVDKRTQALKLKSELEEANKSNDPVKKAAIRKRYEQFYG